MTGPLIGVTGSDRGLPLAWWFTRWALWRSGARAVYLTHSNSIQLETLDGIVISGGDDIDRGLYLAEHDAPGPADPERDRFEIRVLEHLMGSRLPVLGICRGAQLMNVVRGGTLYPDLRSLRRKTSNRRTPLARKTLLVEPGSGLEGMLGESRLRINSLHQQAIKDLGEGLVISGRDLDGFVQAVEHPGEPFLYGVQWHPEYLPLHASQRELFRTLVRAAAGDEPRALR
ncbi:MAG: gamma-glutamyl-gamma-aminobutyrate hydrolase family protein [Haliea sp.]|uniref:gamma-glutamyl-gamma-aminobutyrate hydrolase family protein n=1 Tax=Haliea sp. TaxID=1932666 RepID=UPI0032EDF925